MEIFKNREHQRSTLGMILKDEQYLPRDSSSYRGFIADMKSAIEKGRTITPKMDSAIKKLVKKYDEWKDPDLWYIRTIERDRILRKLKQLRSKLERANYTNAYITHTESFLNSIEEQASRRHTLSMGQMVALNRMYKKFNKRIEKFTSEKIKNRVS